MSSENVRNSNNFNAGECSTSVQLLRAVQQNDVTGVEEILPLLTVEDINRPFGPLQVTALLLASASVAEGSVLLVELLLKHGANADYKDKLGRTALHCASSNGQLELVKLLVENGANINARYEVNSLPRNVQVNGDYGITKSLPLPDCWGRTALHQAVKNHHADIVKFLLDNGASVDSPDEHGLTPILLAGAGISITNIQSYEEIISLLISKGADVNVANKCTGTTCLHHSVALNSYIATESLLQAGAVIKDSANGQTPLHEAAGRGHCDLLCLLLRYENMTVNRPDHDGRTALHKAAFAGSRDCVRVLLEHGGDLSAETTANVSVMDVVYSHVPRPIALIKEILNSRITSNNVSVNDINFKVMLDFKILSPRGKDRQMSVISSMLDAGSNHQTIELLQHPLIECYLYMKWERLRMFFFLLVFLQFIFVLSLSTYVMLIVHQPVWGDFLIAFSRNILLLSAFALFVHAIIQCLLVPRHYFKQYEMWLNLLCAFVSFIVAITGQTNSNAMFVDPIQIPNGTVIDIPDTTVVRPQKWVLHITSIAVLLAWIELMLLIGRFPAIGYYALMFSAVLQNVVKVLLTFVCLVIGFALSFSVQFHTFEQFEDPWRAIVKTTVMMMGEFEYADLFADKGANGDPARLPATSRVIFIMFIILSSIVLMNLMVGVAVNDIQGLQREGHVKRLAKQATFLSHLEKVLSHKLMRSEWVPSIVHPMLYNRKCVNTTLVIKPALLASKDPDNKKVKCLPRSTIESIVQVAVDNNSPFSNEELVDNRSIMLMLKSLAEQIKEMKLNLETKLITPAQ